MRERHRLIPVEWGRRSCEHRGVGMIAAAGRLSMDEREARERNRQMSRWNSRVSYAAVVGQLRRQRGLGRAQLAALSGVPEALIQELEEADRDRLSPEQTQALASALGTSWSEIQDAARLRARAMSEDH
jgi:ribosome-binding protein aMBF1 (putative translation factor)